MEECTTAAAAAAVEDRKAEEKTGPPAKRQRVDDAQPDSLSILDACLKQFLASAEPAASEQNSVEMEIDRFISITPVDRSKYPTACDCWRENHHLYPNVTRVVKCYLSGPLTSVASERLFSSASHVFTDRLNRLAPKKADMLLFIKHSLPLISFYSACNARIASAVLATAIPSVRLSVCPSHAGIVSKRRHVAWCSLHRWIAKCV